MQQMVVATTPESRVAAHPGPFLAMPPVQADGLYGHIMSSKLRLLWEPRFVVAVPQGHAFLVGDAVVRIGEVRQERWNAGASGSAPMGRNMSGGVRAVVCVIEMGRGEAEEEEDEEDVAREGGEDVVMVDEDREVSMGRKKKAMTAEQAEFARQAAREMWQSLGIPGGKEYITGAQGDETAEDVVRLWCEVLKFRG
ncbi:hypothetical protein BDY21DRAFT_347414, partial [Lineolata rhizophorae]